MGRLVRAICLNPSCNYTKKLRYGTGWIEFANLWSFRESLLTGQENNPEAVKILRNDGELRSNGIYLCPTCKDFATSETYYCHVICEFFEEYDYDGSEETVYDTVFPFGIPKCEMCGTDLQYIDEDFFGSIRCPQCGGSAVLEMYGFFD